MNVDTIITKWHAAVIELESGLGVATKEAPPAPARAACPGA